MNDIERIGADVHDAETALQHVEDVNLMKLNGPVASCLARMHGHMNGLALETQLLGKLLES